MKNRTIAGIGMSLAVAAWCLMTASAPAQAQQITLKLHNFNSPRAIANRLFMKPWAKKIEKESGGRLKIQIYPAMQLGGKARDLYAQARDGVVDLAWSRQGFHSGQFPLTAVFELPFLGTTGTAVSQALTEFQSIHLGNEYKDVHPVVLHATDGSILMTKTPVRRLEDLRGMKIRTPSRWIGEGLKAQGAAPVAMALPALSEALTRGQVQGMVISWSITRPFKYYDLVKNHTEVPVSVSPFMLIMNKKSYAKLPADLKRIIDANGGMKLAKKLGQLWDADAKKSYAIARKKGNTFISLSAAEEARWRKAARPAIDGWIAMANAKGYDGRKMYQDAVRLVEKYGK